VALSKNQARLKAANRPGIAGEHVITQVADLKLQVLHSLSFTVHNATHSICYHYHTAYDYVTTAH
jgi:hypothetical protein